MSLHRFETQLGDTKIVVTMGWDRPLQGYFMTIMKLKPASSSALENDLEEDCYLFNNLEQTNSHPRELTAYLFELENRGIEIPQRVIDEVTMDGVRNVGNKVVNHCYFDGKYVREEKL